MKAIEILNKLNKAEHWEDYYPSKMQCNEAIAELEALENRSCDKCKFGKFGIDSFGVEIECSLNWDCIRGRTIDRWESRC